MVSRIKKVPFREVRKAKASRTCRARHFIRNENVTKTDRNEDIETLVSSLKKFEEALRLEFVRLADQVRSA